MRGSTAGDGVGSLTGYGDAGLGSLRTREKRKGRVRRWKALEALEAFGEEHLQTLQDRTGSE